MFFIVAIFCACVGVQVNGDLFEVNETIYSGILTPGCVSNYVRLYISRSVPPRTYRYYHETLALQPAKRRVDENNDLQWRIVGGTKVSITDVPYSVMYGLYCGGTLIAPKWVLTAAHCKEKEKYVYVGSTYRSSTMRYRICAHYTHPLWIADSKLHSHDFDYQLLLLEKAIPVTTNTIPIAIGTVDDIKPGGMITVSGWGHLKSKDRMHENIRKVSIPIIPREKCMSFPKPNYHNITERMFCAGYLEGAKDACQGDSGGPAVINGKLVGSVSFGVGCAQPDQPGVYTNIPIMREWLRSITTLPL